MIGQLIELGPRNLGSNEGWYWMVPWRGILTNSCGANCSTKAMMPISTSASFIACAASGARSDLNWWTVMPFSCAATRNTSGRAPSFSGAQNTAATVSPRARNASNTAFPKSCCPMIAIFMVPPLFRFRRHRKSAGLFFDRNLGIAQTEHLFENLVGVLAERR